jgi:hypothetical protein
MFHPTMHSTATATCCAATSSSTTGCSRFGALSCGLFFLLNRCFIRCNSGASTQHHVHRSSQPQQHRFWFLHNSLLKICPGQKIQLRHAALSRAPHKMRNHHTISASRQSRKITVVIVAVPTPLSLYNLRKTVASKTQESIITQAFRLIE